MGLTWPWWMPDGVSLESFFHLCHNQNRPGTKKPSLAEISHAEGEINSNSSNKHLSAFNLIKLRELEKDFRLEDLEIVLSSTFNDLETLQSINGKELLPSFILEMSDKIFAIRNQILSNLGE